MSDDKSRARLGRGLASLIGGGGTNPSAARLFPSQGGAATGGDHGFAERLVRIERIVPNPKNPRRAFAAEDLSELSASIRNHGIVQPILVRPKPGEEAVFEIVAGERRWRAARQAGLAQVPIVVRALGDRETLEIAIIENVQRADLNAIEEAQGYEALIAEHGYTQNDLAEILGKSRSHVANTLRLLKLPETVRQMVTAGSLSAGAARTVVSAKDPEAFARRIVEGGLSVREAEEAAREETQPAGRPAPGDRARKAAPTSAPHGGGTPAAAPKDADTMALEQLLAETLAMPVSIDLKGGGGRLSLDFGDLDQLDELCRLLQARSRRTEPRVREL